MSSAVPALNVEYCSLRYSAKEEDNATYTDILRTEDGLFDRARKLWTWTDLSRGVDVETVLSVLSESEVTALTENTPSDAVRELGDSLVERGALASRSVVTPAFILHLADSGPDAYSVRFPIFDIRC